ncbi:alpha/beta fold hydrolase [Bradyrhizobium iriomotense]|uniref:alpha/beta fold hydrolase n=1 Tax=Bradyrhizobium iriomotense TaxID=441950 RepID=UPI001B89FD55|nr:alpha/beta hydrolase [Bradyrhizobium iriomotense]MBR0784762.1 alpha/beta hydrolase [Bradyrhizobium iriomotense]
MTTARVGRVAVTAALALHLATASAAEGPSRHIVDVGSAKIEVTAEGQGPLIVLLPSTGRSSDDFDVLAGGLAKAGFRVLRPQPRGIGGSIGPMTDVSFHDFANDIAGIIKHDGGDPAIIVGHAYGNWIARTVATDYPQLVRGVVLMAAGAKTWPRQLSDAITTINDRNQPTAIRLKALEFAFFAPGNDASSWLEGWHKDVTESQRAAGLNTKRESWWLSGTARILDLQAADDPFRPRDTTDELKNDLGDRVSVVVVPNASHALPAEQPAAVVQAIVAWAQDL